MCHSVGIPLENTELRCSDAAGIPKVPKFTRNIECAENVAKEYPTEKYKTVEVRA